MHAAVVRELAMHPLSPQHPQLALDASSYLNSPYALGVAMYERATGTDVMTALPTAGIINLMLFLIGLYYLTKLVLKSDRAPFYALLFTLFLWGDSPWGYSGFFHLAALGYVLTYPSTFAMAMTLLGWSIGIVYWERRTRGWLLLLVLISDIVLLTHPGTGMIMFIGLICLSVGKFQLHRWLDAFLFFAVIPISLLVAALWPYYPFIRVIIPGGLVLPEPKGLVYGFGEENKAMYEDVLVRIWPALPGIVPLALRLRSNWRDFLLWVFFGMSFVYFAGYVIEFWRLGRVISVIVLVLHLALADTVTHMEARLREAGMHMLFKGMIVILSILLVFLMVFNFRTAILQLLPGDPIDFVELRLLKKFTRQYDVIISDIDTSTRVPVFGGKVVSASNVAPAAVPDIGQRTLDLRRFFAEGTPREERLNLIRKYNARFVLVDKIYVQSGDEIVDDLESVGKVLYTTNNMILIDVSQVAQ